MTPIDRIRRWIFSRLVAKRPPNRISSSVPIVSRDYIWVSGSTRDHTDCLFLEYDKATDCVSYAWWADRGVTDSSDARCPFDEVSWESLSFRHTFRNWDITYDTALWTAISDMFRLPWLRQKIQRFRDRFYHRIRPDQRMEVLSEIVDRHSYFSEIRVIDILINMYGSAVRLSSDFHEIRDHLHFVIESLVESGDVILRDESNTSDMVWFAHGDGEVMPLPQALTTLSQHIENRNRHRDTMRLVRYQLFVGVAMFAIAAATLFVELRKIGYF